MRCVRCVEIVIYRVQRTERLRCVGCVRLVTFVAFRSLRTHRLRCVACVEFGALRCFRVFGSRRYVPNGCVASVAFVPFTSFRSERNDVNARNVSHRLCWLAGVRCKPFIQQPHQPVSVKDCQKKLNFAKVKLRCFDLFLQKSAGKCLYAPRKTLLDGLGTCMDSIYGPQTLFMGLKLHLWAYRPINGV